MTRTTLMPSEGARGVADRQDTLTIGFVTSQIYMDWAMPPWLGAMDAAQARGVNLLTFAGGLVAPAIGKAHDRRPEYQGNVLYDLVDHARLDGLVIWTSPLASHLTAAELAAFCRRYTAFPVVTMEGAVKGWPCVLYGNYQGMRSAVDHLIEVHGYQRIGFVGMLQHHVGFQERYRAYTDALTAHGLPVKEEFVRPWFPDEVILPPDGHIAEAVLRPWLQAALAAGMEALVGVCDTSTLQVLKLLQTQGISVPEELALASFDDFTESRVITPPLTSVMPSWYEWGRLAMDTLIGILDGHPAPDQLVVVPRLMVRQSCGCPDPAVIQAAVGPVSEAASALNHAETTAVIMQTVQTPALKDMSHRVARLVESFTADVSGAQIGLFLSELERVLRQIIAVGGEVTTWQDAISALRRQVLPCLPKGAGAERAEDLWQQARVLIGKTAERVQAYQRLQLEQWATRMRDVGQALINTFDIEGLMNILAERLPGLGVPGCYLALYEQPRPYEYPDPAPEWSQLILAYDERGRVNLAKGEERFRSKQLVPEGFWPQDRCYRMVAEPLYFQCDQIGFVVFEVGTREGSVYETLRGQISSALQGALLVRQTQQDAAALAQKNAELIRKQYILDMFMANVPDSIYFKDRESRIIRANAAHARNAGFATPEGEIGKTDFDFFPDREQAQILHDQEQQIIQTGQPLLNVEEHLQKRDGTSIWSLVTKMPLRDENNKIIGTFGISRDITPLKQAQQELELHAQELAAAYQEIQILNDQLKDDNVRMHTEMELARQIQTALLPKMEQHVHPDFEIAAKMLPAEEVGGDYYDITLDQQGHLWFGIGDVCGHGVTPGLIMMMAQTVHTAITANYQADPQEVVCKINTVLFKNVHGRLGADHFMTFTTLKYVGDGRFQHAGAHLDLIVYRQQTQQCDLIDTKGVWLNFVPDIAYAIHNAEFTLNVGDILVLYTDGLTEAFNPQGQMLDIQGLMDIVRRHVEEAVEVMRDAILADVLAWCDHKRADDMSLVVARRVNGREPS